jgi:hypothetical protein
MRREPPVRIREGLGVKLPRATRLVIGVAREDDARRILEVLPKRMSKYGLTVHAEKTRLVRFHPPDAAGPATKDRAQSDPRTFDFLGFTHYWGRTLQGRWAVKRKTAKGRLQRALHALSGWCRENRHLPVADQHQRLSQKLRGHYGDYGILWHPRQLRQPPGIPGGSAADLEAVAVAATPRRLPILGRLRPTGEAVRSAQGSGGPRSDERRSEIMR